MVVKSEAASGLRRMDGLAASADGSGADSGALMERLSHLDSTLNKLCDRIPVSGGATGAGDAEHQSTRVVQDIKVRVCALIDSLVYVRGEGVLVAICPTVQSGAHSCFLARGICCAFLARPHHHMTVASDTVYVRAARYLIAVAIFMFDYRRCVFRVGPAARRARGGDSRRYLFCSCVSNGRDN